MENINRSQPCGIIKYYIFINNVKNVQDNKTHLLSKIANECIRYVSALAKEYIWHYETFNLRPIINDNKNSYTHSIDTLCGGKDCCLLGNKCGVPCSGQSNTCN